MPLFLLNIWGWILAHKRLVLIGIGIVVLLLLVIGVYRGCSKPPKLDEAEIQKGEQAVKERNDAELRRILVESEVREKEIDANVANANAEKINAIYESRQKWANANTADLQAEFDRRKNQ